MPFSFSVCERNRERERERKLRLKPQFIFSRSTGFICINVVLIVSCLSLSFSLSLSVSFPLSAASSQHKSKSNTIGIKWFGRIQGAQVKWLLIHRRGHTTSRSHSFRIHLFKCEAANDKRMEKKLFSSLKRFPFIASHVRDGIPAMEHLRPALKYCDNYLIFVLCARCTLFTYYTYIYLSVEFDWCTDSPAFQEVHEVDLVCSRQSLSPNHLCGSPPMLASSRMYVCVSVGWEISIEIVGKVPTEKKNVFLHLRSPWATFHRCAWETMGQALRVSMAKTNSIFYVYSIRHTLHFNQFTGASIYKSASSIFIFAPSYRCGRTYNGPVCGCYL